MTMIPDRSAVSVAWSGESRHPSFDWLRERMQQAGFNVDDIGGSLGSSSPIHRIVIPCEDRLSYRSDNAAFEEVPTALALGSWWNGSGRTGLRELPTLAIPWYRWWESWLPWLDGENSNYFSPLPPRSLQFPTDVKTAAKLWERQSGTSIMLIADCADSLQGWDSAAQRLCDKVVTTRWNNRTEHARATPDWILWDDSCLNSSGAPKRNGRYQQLDCEAEIYREFTDRLREEFSGSGLIVAMSMPRWKIYSAMLESGPAEFLTKPENGSGLARILANKSRLCPQTR